MNNRRDSNVSDFQGVLAGTGANAKANKGNTPMDNRQPRGMAGPYHHSPMKSSRGNHA